MGAKTWMLVSSEGLPRECLKGLPALDRGASLALAGKLFPRRTFVEEEDGDLSVTNPPDEQIYVGCFPGVAVVAASEFGLDQPSQLPAHYLKNMPHSTVVLHAMHSAVDWFAFAVWNNGELRRSLSLSPDGGIIEDIGERMAFEAPYWDGRFPVGGGDEGELDEDVGYPFVFHPLDLAEAALAELFGYVIEGVVDDAAFDAEDVPLLTLRWK